MDNLKGFDEDMKGQKRKEKRKKNTSKNRHKKKAKANVSSVSLRLNPKPTHMGQEVDEGVPSEGPHGQGDEELADLLIVQATLQGRDEHDTGQASEANHHHARHCTDPALCRGGGRVIKGVLLYFCFLFLYCLVW